MRLKPHRILRARPLIRVCLILLVCTTVRLDSQAVPDRPGDPDRSC